jgi:repressor of nif and glnA expression
MNLTRTTQAILRVLDRGQGIIMGSRQISRQLKFHGVKLTERTVRYHLEIMDAQRLTKVNGKEGREITQKGREELSKALVSERVGFILSKIETLSCQMSFNPETKQGNIIVNVSYFPRKNLEAALKAMKPVFSSPYVMSDRVILAFEGQNIGDHLVPEDMVGMATVCSITINGIFLKAGIPVTSKFGGLLEVDYEEGPSRFTSLISYEGSSLDPIVIFIKSKMTSVSDTVRKKSGRVLASFREVPVVALERAAKLNETLAKVGIGGILLFGNPNQQLLEMPVGMDKAGMVVVCGLNPIAAIEEAGIPTESKAMSSIVSYANLTPFKKSMKEILQTHT